MTKRDESTPIFQSNEPKRRKRETEISKGALSIYLFFFDKFIINISIHITKQIQQNNNNNTYNVHCDVTEGVINK